MNIDVAKAIKELLYEHESVILPGLGGFTSTPATATVDYIQGSVQPPSRKVDFNTNLVINDGVLVNYIQQNDAVTSHDAKVAIENYVEMVKEALNQREIVDIPHVGRLYKDYEQKIRFMPEGNNFEVESFGLPNVKFSPIVRHKAPVDPPPPPIAKGQPSPTSTVKTTVTSDKNWAEKILPVLIVAASVLLAISLFVWLRGCSSSPIAEVPQERVNVKPKEEDVDKTEGNASADQGDSEAKEDTGDSQTLENSTNNDDEPIVQPIPPSLPSDKAIFIVVHSFGSKENARKFAQDLKRAGYEPSTKFYGGLNRVGVEVPNSRESEVEGLIQELGRKFKSSPVVVDY